MGPYGPGGGEGFERFGPMIDRHDTWWNMALGWLPLLLFMVAIGVAIWAVLRVTSGSRTAAVSATSSEAMAAPRRPDPAVDELRIRYARGEVTREDFLTRGRDLGEDLSAEVPPAPPFTPEGDRSD
jgi:putative membrane protein